VDWLPQEPGTWADWVTGLLTFGGVLYAVFSLRTADRTSEIDTLERLADGIGRTSDELVEASRRENAARAANDAAAHALAIEDIENAFSRKLNFLEQTALALNENLLGDQSKPFAEDMLKDALAEIYAAPFFLDILNKVAAKGGAMRELYRFACLHIYDIQNRKTASSPERRFPPW